MKRNLSSHIIKAMTIGMAFAMGTTTVMSGVVVNKPVMAYAQTQQKSLKGDGSYYNEIGASLKANDYVKTSDGLLFQVNADGNTLTFLGGSTFNTEATQYSLDGSTQDKAYLVNYSNGTVTLTPGVDNSATDVTTTVNGKSFTFSINPTTNEAILKSVGGGSYLSSETVAPELKNGVLTVNGVGYNFTTIDSTVTANLKYTDLLGNVDNLTTIKTGSSIELDTAEVDFPNVTTLEGTLSGNSVKTLSLPNVTELKSAPASVETLKLGANTTIGNGALTNVASASLTIEGIQTIGELGNLNTSLKTISLPNVKTVEANAFNGCADITTINLPSVTNIGAAAFNGTTALEKINLENAALESIAEDALTNAGDSAKVTANNQTTIEKVETVAEGKTENAAPTLKSASLNADGDAITLTFSEDVKVKGDSAEAGKKFTVKSKTSNSSGHTENTITIKDNTITLTGFTKIGKAEKGSVKVSFTNDSTNTITDTADTPAELATFGETPVQDAFVVPKVQSGVVNDGDDEAKKKIVLTLDSDVTESGLAKTDFNVSVGGSAAAEPSEITVEGNTVTLVLTTPVTAGQTVIVNAKTANVECKNLIVTNNIKPELSQATFGATTVAEDGKSISITLTGTPYQSLNKNDIKDFTLTVNEEQRTITNLEHSGSTITLTLDKAIQGWQDVKLTYSGDKAKGDINVTNNATKPNVETATVNVENPNQITFSLGTNETGVSLDNSDKGDFTIQVASQPATITSISTVGNDVTVTLQDKIKHNQTVNLKYTGKKITLSSVDATNGIQFSQENVTAKTIENGAKIVLTLDAKDNATQQGDATPKDFELVGSDKEITQVEVQNKTITLTLNEALTDVNNVKLNYTATPGNEIKVGEVTLSLSNLEVTKDEVTPPEETKKITVTAAMGDTADKIALSVNSDDTLKDGAITPANDFKVKVGDSDVTTYTVKTANVEVGGKSVTLTLDKKLNSEISETVKVSYTGENLLLDNNTTKAIFDETDVGGVANIADHNKKVTATTTDGTTITVTALGSETFNTSSVPTVTDFVVNVNGNTTNTTVESVSDASNGNTFTLTLTGTSIANGDTVTLSYTGTEAKINDNGEKALVLTDKAVTNSVSEVYSTSVMMSERAVATSTRNATLNGNVTIIKSITGATEAQVQKVLTSKLTKIETGAFKNAPTMKLDFTNVDVNNLTIETGAFDEKGNVTFVCDGKAKAETLASKLETSGVKDVVIKDSSGNEIVKPKPEKPQPPVDNGGSSSGSSGGGANIGVSVEDNNQNNNNNNNSGNVTNPTFENKDLTFDVISLPSVDGEPKVFGDIAENHWAKSHIDKLSTAGIINGIDGNFQPNGQTKRADATIMLVKLLGLSTEGGNRFADVDPNAYYAPYVNTAATYGIVNGSNGMFNPNGIISRQDTMVMIAQILKGLDLNVNTDTTALNQFSDAANVSGYAQESVAILINSGIITGNNGKLNPTAPVTRAEMATIMSKLYDVLASANK